jgi:hypothetical protein
VAQNDSALSRNAKPRRPLFRDIGGVWQRGAALSEPSSPRGDVLEVMTQEANPALRFGQNGYAEGSGSSAPVVPQY